MVWSLNETGNFRHDHRQNLPDLRVSAFIDDCTHCRYSTVRVLGIAIDISTIGDDVGVGGVELFKQACGFVQVVHSHHCAQMTFITQVSAANVYCSMNRAAASSRTCAFSSMFSISGGKLERSADLGQDYLSPSSLGLSLVGLDGAVGL